MRRIALVSRLKTPYPSLFPAESRTNPRPLGRGLGGIVIEILRQRSLRNQASSDRRAERLIKKRRG